MSGMVYGELRFGSLDEETKEVHLRCLDEGKGVIKEGLELCLERGNAQGEYCSIEAQEICRQ